MKNFKKLVQVDVAFAQTAKHNNHWQDATSLFPLSIFFFSLCGG
jgi:hypothetical protein